MEYQAYLDKNLSFLDRAKDLVSKMTLLEKASQTTYQSPAIERLGIPAYNWWNEALHGVARAGTATVFPQAIGLAAMFSEEALEKTADIISTEGRAMYNMAAAHGDHDIYKGLTYWSPNVNIFRDPRWGRGHETYGEDPYLTAQLGKAFVRGLQGDGEYLKSAACAKHFAVHSGPENLRHEFDAVVNKMDLYDTYLPAFEALVKETKVEAVMGAYNRTNGEPCCGSKTLLADILRGAWGFSGHVLSDCWAIKDLNENHKVTKTATESVAMALKNGCDLNCGNIYLLMLNTLQEGLITEEDIDRAVIRLMTTRIKLGMYDELSYDNIPYDVVSCDEHADFNYEVTKQTLVLLKNNGILPLNKNKIKSIGVIGPNADSILALLGNYNGTPMRGRTVLGSFYDELKNSGIRLRYSEGSHLWKDKVEDLAQFPYDRISEAVMVAEQSDVLVLCLGLDSRIEGEEGDEGNTYGGGDKADLDFPKPQLELFSAVAKTGKPIILVSMTGSAMNFTEIEKDSAAIIQAWYPGEQGGRAIKDLIFGEFSPSGKMPVTIYEKNDDLPEFTDYNMEGRTYRYMKAKAFYPFGYGLSYTSFLYECIGEKKVDFSEAVKTFRFKIKNKGKMEGHEKIQLYVKDLEASVRVPNFSLRRILSVYLHAGEEKTIEFTLNKNDFSIVNENGERIMEKGDFKVFIGSGQPDIRTKELIDTNFIEYDVKY